MYGFKTLLLLLSLAFAASATGPAALKDTVSFAKTILSACPASSVNIPLPVGLALSANETANLVTVRRGIENYTCTNGTFVSAGAVADLYDVTCVFTATTRFASAATVSELLPQLALNGLDYPDVSGLPVAVKHFFTEIPTGSIAPVFVSSTDRVVLRRDSGVDAVDPTVNVPYLKLVAVEGTLSRSVFRLDTAGGQPPTSCTAEGQTTTVPYAAMYYFAK